MSYGRPYISKIEGCIHDGWLVIRGNDDIYISDYLYYYLSSTFAFNQFSESASGATVDNLSIDKVKSSWISVPSIEEQKRIVEKIEQLFEILDKIDEAQKKYQEDKEILKSKIIEAGIRGKLTKQLKSDGDASSLLDEIRKEKEKLIKEGKIKRDKKETYIYKNLKDNLYYEKYQDGTEKCINDELPFEIPENWVWVKFNNIVNYHMGKTPPRADNRYWKDAKYNWVTIADMIPNGTIVDTKQKVNDYSVNNIFNNRISKKGTLIMSFKLTVGRVSILGKDAYHNEAIISIYPYCDMNNIFRNYLFAFLPIITVYGDTKTAIKGNTLNTESLNNLVLPLPPLAEQE